MIARVRRRVLLAARALATKGTVPPGVEDPRSFTVRAPGLSAQSG
jgi:hypothetical protein